MTEWMTSRRTVLQGTLAGLLSGALPGISGSASAQQGKVLKIGMFSPNNSMDPHLTNNAPSNAVAMHIFDSLINLDKDLKNAPGLATEWKLLSPTRWEFTLRPNVKFHDGKAFTAEDVIASFNRANTIQGTTTYQNYTRGIVAVSSPEPGKVIFETKTPNPQLPNFVARIRIIRAEYAAAQTSDFNSGKAAIGTGAFRFKDYVPGTSIGLTANPDYWGGKPEWNEVTLKILGDGAARLAALMSGDVDIIEQVLYESLTVLKNFPKAKVITGASSRTVIFALDSGRDVSKYITDLAGDPLPKNPFKDIRVRQAFSMALNRQAIVERVMEGHAVVATQVVAPGTPGSSTKVQPVPFDVEKAKALLAEAGYPKGFGLTIHGPYHRIVNDTKIVQAAAQMLKRIGIEAKVEVMPWTVYSTKNNTGEFSMSLNSYGATTGEAGTPLAALLATHDAKKGTGNNNQGRYSNPAFDAKLEAARAEMDEAKRNAMLAECSEMVAADYALIPLHHEVVILAARKELNYEVRKDQYTLAAGVKG